jgi:hypothetical protein
VDADLVEHGGAVRVGEADLVERDLAAQPAGVGGALAHLGFGLQQRPQPLGGGQQPERADGGLDEFVRGEQDLGDRHGDDQVSGHGQVAAAFGEGDQRDREQDRLQGHVDGGDDRLQA